MYKMRGIYLRVCVLGCPNPYPLVPLTRCGRIRISPIVEDTLEAWFTNEVLPHEESLTRFLSRRWRDRDELADLRQETYARVYEAAQKVRPSVPRAFLFTTAMHLLTDRLRRGRIVTYCTTGNEEHLNALVDEISPEHQILADVELAQLNRALNRLAPKCREVVWMRRVQDLPQREVAERLGVSEKTVEKHLRLGTRKLAEWLRS